MLLIALWLGITQQKNRLEMLVKCYLEAKVLHRAKCIYSIIDHIKKKMTQIKVKLSNKMNYLMYRLLSV